MDTTGGMFSIYVCKHSASGHESQPPAKDADRHIAYNCFITAPQWLPNGIAQRSIPFPGQKPSGTEGAALGTSRLDGLVFCLGIHSQKGRVRRFCRRVHGQQRRRLASESLFSHFSEHSTAPAGSMVSCHASTTSNQKLTCHLHMYTQGYTQWFRHGIHLTFLGWGIHLGPPIGSSEYGYPFFCSLF